MLADLLRRRRAAPGRRGLEEGCFRAQSCLGFSCRSDGEAARASPWRSKPESSCFEAAAAVAAVGTGLGWVQAGRQRVDRSATRGRVVTGALTPGLELIKCGHSSKGIHAFGTLATTTSCRYAAKAHGLAIKQPDTTTTLLWLLIFLHFSSRINDPTVLCSTLMASGQVKEPGDCKRSHIYTCTACLVGLS